MALIKIQGNTKIQGKTIFDTGYKVSDANAAAYISAVEAADGDVLEDPVKEAIDSFIIGCKSDGIWNSLKASCILAGARTLNGALVPLVGTAPTNFNFVSADYNRETGLKGDGSTKYLNSNRAGNDDPVDSKHLFVNFSEKWTRLTNSTGGNTNFTALGQYNLSGASNIIGNTYGFITLRANGATKNLPSYTTSYPFGGVGASVSGTTLDWLFNNDGSAANPTTTSGSVGGVTPSILAGNIGVFGVLQGSRLIYQSNPMLSFYSIGESLDLALLDTRVSNLMTAIQAAI
jgi:hypothetical protein